MCCLLYHHAIYSIYYTTYHACTILYTIYHTASHSVFYYLRQPHFSEDDAKSIDIVQRAAQIVYKNGQRAPSVWTRGLLPSAPRCSSAAHINSDLGINLELAANSSDFPPIPSDSWGQKYWPWPWPWSMPGWQERWWWCKWSGGGEGGCRLIGRPYKGGDPIRQPSLSSCTATLDRSLASPLSTIITHLQATIALFPLLSFRI